MRRRFFWGVMLVAAATLAIGGLAAAVLINRSVERSAREEFSRQAQATAGLIENELSEIRPGPARRTIDLAALLRTVRVVGGHDYVEAVLVGPLGVVTALGPETELISQIPGGVTGVRGRMPFEADVGGQSVEAFALAVPAGDRGSIVVAIGTDLELVPWRDVLVRFVWAIALAAVLAAVLAGSLSRFLGKRLEGLHDASRRLAAGDLSARVPAEGDDEITEVAGAFNDMAAQLEAARRREREFLASVGHDLRTPLTTIGGYAEALAEGKVAGDRLSEVAGILDRESGRLSRLVEDLMLLTRLEAREFSLRPEEVDLAGHLGGIAESFGARARNLGVRLETDLHPLPPTRVDPDRVAQVVGNLLENALRYTPEGGRVRLGLRDESGTIVITVSDDGPGIEPADLPHIFERLYVTQRYRPIRPEGSGLGLSIVRELVDAMGGATSVESSPGAGTSIVVRLPPGR